MQFILSRLKYLPVFLRPLFLKVIVNLGKVFSANFFVGPQLPTQKYVPLHPWTQLHLNRMSKTKLCFLLLQKVWFPNLLFSRGFTYHNFSVLLQFHPFFHFHRLINFTVISFSHVISIGSSSARLSRSRFRIYIRSSVNIVVSIKATSLDQSNGVFAETRYLNGDILSGFLYPPVTYLYEKS